MNTFKKKCGLAFLAVSSAALIGANREAAWAAQDDYKFEVVGQPSGTTLSLRLVKATNEQPVADAHIFAIHRQWLAAKGQPRPLDVRIALTPVGNGTFIYEGDDVQPGVTIRLVAQIDNSDSDVAGSVRVGW
jgi:hypothetical protein